MAQNGHGHSHAGPPAATQDASKAPLEHDPAFAARFQAIQARRLEMEQRMERQREMAQKNQNVKTGPVIYQALPPISKPDIFLASQAGLVERVEELLAQQPALLTAVPSPGAVTAFHLAAIRGQPEIVRLFIKLGADVKSVTGQRQATALHYAAQGGYVSIVRMLLDAGADINAQDGAASTPLLYAAPKGHEAVMVLLHARGADMSHKDVVGATALFAVSKQKGPKYQRCMEFLINAGNSPVHVDNHQQTPLHMAAMSGDHLHVRLLMKLGANYNIKDYQGKDPVNLALEDKERRPAALEFMKWMKFKGDDKRRFRSIDILLTDTLNHRGFCILLCCLMPWPYYVYCTRMFHLVEPTYGYGFLIINVLAWYIFYLSATLPPGFITRSEEREAKYWQGLKELGLSTNVDDASMERALKAYCHVCKIIKPGRTSHDYRGYERCVQDHDHYCDFILNTIGLRNRRYFLSALWVLTLSLIFQLYKYFFVLTSEQRDVTYLSTIGVWAAIILTLPAGVLTLYVSIAALTGRSYTDVLHCNWKRNRDFDQGMLNNCLHFWSRHPAMAKTSKRAIYAV
eukprot:TRINITY_DN11066_c0_g1_i3.p1 TRINITY_DN11066_c0_g1~~TRINITY_DN11066_c0_g1_i3.p1  ORF type:complete len:571 (+),score=121.02 TRINITY_DN11066_c0_g1_i3:3-1715(+)